MFAKILVPLDGSPAAEAAVPLAAHLAGLSQGEVELVRCPLLPGERHFPIVSPAPVSDPESQRCETYLMQQSFDLKQAGINCSYRVLEAGHVASRIVEAAEQGASDLIVITSHGHSGVVHMLWGSVAEKVARHAPCPVMVVRRPGS